MPRRTPPLLGDDLVDAYRVFITEVYDALAAAGFPDLPQAAATVFRDIDGRGSLLSDLAYHAGLSPAMMRSVIADLEASGYVEVDGDRVLPAERGHAAFEAGRQALAEIEDRWAQRLGPERFAVFREVLHDFVEYGRGGKSSTGS